MTMNEQMYRQLVEEMLEPLKQVEVARQLKECRALVKKVRVAAQWAKLNEDLAKMKRKAGR
jgi:hypothetical protein